MLPGQPTCLAWPIPYLKRPHATATAVFRWPMAHPAGFQRQSDRHARADVVLTTPTAPGATLPKLHDAHLLTHVHRQEHGLILYTLQHEAKLPSPFPSPFHLAVSPPLLLITLALLCRAAVPPPDPLHLPSSVCN
jgi:hypothetical protein